MKQSGARITDIKLVPNINELSLNYDRKHVTSFLQENFLTL